MRSSKYASIMLKKRPASVLGHPFDPCCGWWTLTANQAINVEKRQILLSCEDPSSVSSTVVVFFVILCGNLQEVHL